MALSSSGTSPASPGPSSGSSPGQAPGTTGPGSPAAPRTTLPTRGLLPLLLAGNTAMYALYVGVPGLLLALQIEAVDPAAKVANFGLVSGVSAIFATVFNPVAARSPTARGAATRGSWRADCSRCP
ncbi:hypothetical protein RGF97_02135 [Streptomyces roseicoloratus]|uniref:Major facilitator superfamily (MFS) profile domain-containing protein n=1 Tax=Streptomyces roseicoloratus TaxID=2508722 RepID=A0ABY9RSI2_9ACTN|nr:hypothetical protein [Streptomyces roseicoloratus]WMX43905.1 hypothetical protein RGF97_02135 [Streptomyces roseicoloratus]